MEDKNIQANAARKALASSVGSAEHIPEVLYDGYAVYSELTEYAQRRTSPENVSDTLDAIVRLLKQNTDIIDE